MSHISEYFPITDPTLIFFVVLLIILSAPIIMGKLRIPHIIGMVIAGVVMGPHGLNILAKDSSFELFGHVGLYYIMFLAGLEMDMSNFRKNRVKTFTHGILAFIIPMIMGLVVNIGMLQYALMTSVLLASMYASHTLVAYPTVMRYGLTKERSVAIAVGATAITDTLTLLVLAVIGSMFKGDLNGSFWILLTLMIAVVFFVIIFLFPRMARFFFRRYEDNVTQFIFVLAMTFLGAWLMELIGLEGLLGAFLTGIVLNRYVPDVSPLMTHLEFVGNAIFIPYFLISVGMLVNVRLLFSGLDSLQVAAVMTTVALISKWVASLTTQKIFGMRSYEREMIFGLSNAQAGATLAAVLVGYNIITPDGSRLLNDDVLNGTIILILVTCIFSSFTTDRASRHMVLATRNIRPDENSSDGENIMIPIKSADTANGLANMAITMLGKRHNSGLIAINVVYDDEDSSINQKNGRDMLGHIEKMARAADVKIQTQVRIANNVLSGIKHAFKEYGASELILGMHPSRETQGRLWGQLSQGLYSGLSRQIMLVSYAQPLNTIRHINVAVPSKAEFEPGFCRWLGRLLCMAGNLSCRIEFHSKQATLDLIAEYTSKRYASVRAEYTLMSHWNELPELAAAIKHDHLFVVVTARKGTVSYKSALDRLPDELATNFKGSNLMIIFPDQYGDASKKITFAEPQSHNQRSAYEQITTWMRHRMKHWTRHS